MVPKGWREVKLSQVSTKVMVGIANAATHAYSETGIVLFRNLNIKESGLDCSDLLYISEEYEKQHRGKRLQGGDILTVRTGYPGVSAVVPAEYSGSQCFTSLITRLMKEHANPEYVCYYINSDLGRRFITSGEAGGAQKNVNAGTLKEMPILLPPPREQSKIIEVLSTWDKAIEAVGKLIENSQKQKKWLMQNLLTGKKRLPGFSGEWRQYKLNDVCSPKQWPTIGSEQLVDHGYPVYGANGFIGYYHEYNHVGETIAVTCRGSTCGEVTLVPPMSYITGNSMSLDDVNDEVCDAKYLYYALCARGLDDIISGSAQPQIIGKDIKRITVSCPPVEEQRKIATTLEAADSLVISLSSHKKNLETQKSSLMQQLLTGRRRVKVDNASSSPA